MRRYGRYHSSFFTQSLSLFALSRRLVVHTVNALGSGLNQSLITYHFGLRLQSDCLK